MGILSIKKWTGFACVIGIALLFAGCVREAVPEFRELPPETEQVKKRAASLAALWGRDAVRSVLLQEQDLRYYRNDRDGLTARLKAMNVNHACLVVESPEILESRSSREDLTGMITAMAGAGISSDVVLPQYAFLRTRPANSLIRWFSGDETPLDEAVSCVVRMRDCLPDNVPAPGLTVWAGLHRLTRNNEALPPGTIYRWSESDYGAGSDNDLLMKKFIADLAVWRERAHKQNVRFSVAIPAFYHARARAGELSRGLVSDFLTAADTVLVIGYGEKPSEYLRSLQDVLKSDSSGRIRCGMVLAGHMSDNTGALRRRSWQDFFQILSVMHQNCGSAAGYGGMVLVPWQSVELLQER